jgi:hypothetical protein
MVVEIQASSDESSVTKMRIWTDKEYDSGWIDYSDNLKSVPLADTYFVQFKDARGLLSEIYSDTQHPPGGPPDLKDCIVSGCNSELCINIATYNPIAETLCVWKEESACYKLAICELQADGYCGWTHTPDSRACLGSVNAIPNSSFCELKGGKWLGEYNECEGINAQDCSDLGGTFQECNSACRHEAQPVDCIEICVQVCYL